VVPVAIFDKSGAYINGLQPGQFRLYDNNKEQSIQVDFAYQPISMVIAIQSNSRVETILPAIHKIGGLISPLVIGEYGEAAVIAYDSRIRKIQDFTSNSDLLSKAVKGIAPGSTSNRLFDAIEEGVRMLDLRPKNRRRVFLVIGESRDLASEFRARETLVGLQLANVVLYAAAMPRLLATLSAQPTQPRWVQQPPAAFPPLVAGYPQTPTTVAQAFGLEGYAAQYTTTPAQVFGLEGHTAQFVPLMVDLLKNAKDIFNDNPLELFTKGTGGSEFGFYRQRGLEEAIQQIGEELHSQYLISYSPNNKEEGGFHQISIDLLGLTAIDRIQTRPGYWLAAKLK
jgi:VWFA-related protein